MSKPIFPVQEGDNMIMAEFQEPVNSVPADDGIIDIDLSVTKKKKFRFDHDDSRIVEINTSDVGILSRISEAYPKLEKLQENAGNVVDGVNLESEEMSAEDMNTVSERLKAIDKEMRDLIDFVFDADVSSKAAPSGSMYDPFNGSFRFEHILATLTQLYENNMAKEFKSMEKQFTSHTSKYTHK